MVTLGRLFSRWCLIAVSLAALAGCVPPIRVVPPDWENPGHRLVGEELLPLLQAVGRDPQTCGVVFFETEHLNATSLGNCTFGFTTGLADTRDPVLITGIAAHEVAHDALAHAEKADAAVTTARVAGEVARSIPGGWGVVASLGIILASAVILPTYSRSLEAAADEKALEILTAEGDADPPGTMIHAFEVLLAREGIHGGGILATHPRTTARLEALREGQAREPLQPATVTLPRAPVNVNVFRTIHVPEPSPPPDPRAAWSERYKRMAVIAAEQENAAATTPTTPDNTQASE